MIKFNITRTILLLLLTMIFYLQNSMAMESEEKKDQSILIAETLYQSRAAFRNNLEEFTTLQSTLQHYKSLPEFPHDFLEEHETSNQQAIADLTQRIQELDVMIENLRTNIFKAVKRKIPDQSETLVGSELVLTAASQIADPETREKILDLCKAFHKNIDLLINWFLEEISNPNIILNHWKQLTLGGRPIIKVPNSWEAQQTFICIEDLIKGLHNDWQGEPIIIHGEHHVATIIGQRNDKEKTFHIDFYDAYEPFATYGSSYLEIATLVDFLYNQFPEYDAKVKPHYTRHQKLTSFGECGLYAYVYYNILKRGDRPDDVAEETVLKEVDNLKQQIRQDDPEYFDSYDVIFQYVFDSGFAEILSNTIQEHQKTKRII